MNISGKWYNELGSVMDIIQDGANIVGKYQTGVTEGQPTSAFYPLTGLIDIVPSNTDDGSQAIGFTVVWTFGKSSYHSVTTWSGQYQCQNGEEEIVAFWLLTTEQNAANDWAATQVGRDIFTRVCPTQADIDKAKRRGSYSHPNE